MNEPEKTSVSHWSLQLTSQEKNLCLMVCWCMLDEYENTTRNGFSFSYVQGDFPKGFAECIFQAKPNQRRKTNPMMLHTRSTLICTKPQQQYGALHRGIRNAQQVFQSRQSNTLPIAIGLAQPTGHVQLIPYACIGTPIHTYIRIVQFADILQISTHGECASV